MSSTIMNQSYANCIKQYLVLRCYRSLSQKIAQKMELSGPTYIDNSYTNEFTKQLSNLMHDTSAWNAIFNELWISMKYLYCIHTKIQSESWAPYYIEKNKYKHLICRIYPFESTFQEYIDNYVSGTDLHTYEQFVDSMENNAFKGNMYKNYEKCMLENKLKNEIIHDTYMYFMSFHSSHTDESVELAFNIIPYYEYLSQHPEINLENRPDENDYIIEKPVKNEKLNGISKYMNQLQIQRELYYEAVTLWNIKQMI